MKIKIGGYVFERFNYLGIANIQSCSKLFKRDGKTYKAEICKSFEGNKWSVLKEWFRMLLIIKKKYENYETDEKSSKKTNEEDEKGQEMLIN